MAEFKEVMKQKDRMCWEGSFNHNNCPLFREINEEVCDIDLCNKWIDEHPQKAEEIIMKWAEEHPLKTNLDKFKEIFGFEPYADACILEKGIKCSNCKYKGATKDGTCSSKWWKEEYKERKEVE